MEIMAFRPLVFLIAHHVHLLLPSWHQSFRLAVSVSHIPIASLRVGSCAKASVMVCSLSPTCHMPLPHVRSFVHTDAHSRTASTAYARPASMQYRYEAQKPFKHTHTRKLSGEAQCLLTLSLASPSLYLLFPLTPSGLRRSPGTNPTRSHCLIPMSVSIMLRLL